MQNVMAFGSGQDPHHFRFHREAGDPRGDLHGQACLGGKGLGKTDHHASIADILGPASEARARRDHTPDVKRDGDAETGPGGWACLQAQEIIPNTRVDPGPCREGHAHSAGRVLGHPDHNGLDLGDAVPCKQAEARRGLRSQGPRGFKHQSTQAHILGDTDGPVVGHRLAFTEDRQAKRESGMSASYGMPHVSHMSSPCQ